jgi:hypothetical protein
MRTHKEVPTAGGVATSPVEDLRLEVSRLVDELESLPGRKRLALEGDQADEFAQASLRELELPALIKFSQARLLRSQHAETSSLIASNEAMFLELKSAMTPLVETRDEVFRRTDAERIEAQRACDDASLRIREAHERVFVLRGELASFERQIEALLAAEGG